MRFSYVLSSLSLAVSSSLLAQPVFAHSSETAVVQVANFPQAVETHMVRHHDRLYSLNELSDGSLSVMVANKKADQWVAVPSTHASVEAFIAATSQVNGFAKFKNDIYVATQSSEGLGEVWKICVGCKQAAWTQVGTSGFGDLNNVNVLSFMRTKGQLFALVDNPNGDNLYQTSDGQTWEAVSDAGFGQSITDAVAVSGMFLSENPEEYEDVSEEDTVEPYLYLGTTSGDIYRGSLDDLSQWSLVTSLDGAVTAMRRKQVAVEKGGVAQVLKTEDGVTFSQMGEDDLGNSNNTSVNKFAWHGYHLVALTVNPIDGAEIRHWDKQSESWELVTEAGFGDPDNTQINHLIRYHGRDFASTLNAVDGPSIYRLKIHL